MTERLAVNVHAILVALLSVPHTREQAEHAAHTVLDLHAHELAELQRQAIDAFDRDDHWGTHYRPDDVEGLPDLIDPKAQHATTPGDPT